MKQMTSLNATALVALLLCVTPAITACDDLVKMSPAESERAARRLLTKAAMAAGGIEAMERLRSLRATGTITGKDGGMLDVTILFRPQAKQIRVEGYSPLLRQSTVLIANGNHVLWYDLGASRPQIAKGDWRARGLKALRTSSWLVVAGALRRPPGKLRLVDERTVEVDFDELPPVRLTFDEDKHLVGRRLGDAAETRYTDHRWVNGLLLPHRAMHDGEPDLVFSKVEINPPLTRAQIYAPARLSYTVFKIK